MADWIDASALAELVRQACVQHPKLRKAKYRKHSSPYAGFCYIASEAYYHLVGGKDSIWTPAVMECDCGEKNDKQRDTHWFLFDANGQMAHWNKVDSLPERYLNGLEAPDIRDYILDLTSEQFDSLDYENFSTCGFLTKQPSKRAQVLIDWVLEEI